MRAMRKLIIAIIVMIGVMFIITRFAEIEDIVLTLQSGDWRFIVLAGIVEALWLINIGATFKVIFKALGVSEPLGRMILLVASANFVNIVAPSMGVGGMAVFISEARTRNYSAGRATVASTLLILFDYLGFLTVLTLGFVVLIRRHSVTPPEVTASIILICIAILLAVLLYLGARSEQKLANLLAWTAKWINKIVKPFRRKHTEEYLSVHRAYSFAHEIAEGVNEIKSKTRDLLFPAILALNGKVLMILVLYFVFRSFEVPVSIGTLIAGFCIAYLFMIVSPTPSGIGIVEGFLTLALSSFYIPLGTAAVITLAFRGFTFWLPLLFGLFAFRWVGLSKNQVTA